MRAAIITSLITLAISFVWGAPARAGDAYGLYDVSVQTRDGSAWREGDPIVLVVRATAANRLFAETALSVVMQTDGERTKCLDVAMKRVSSDGPLATYAGVFYPFRAAAYDGRFSIGEDVHEIRFTVSTRPAAAVTSIPTGAELPVLAPVTFDYGPSPLLIAALVTAGIAGLASTVLVVLARRRRSLLTA